MLLELMDELDAPRERTLMIGDTTHDLQMAANAGVAGVAVHHGAHPEEQLAALRPLRCVPSTEELAAMAAPERLICTSGALAEAGDGVRFEVVHAGEAHRRFVVRYDGAPRALPESLRAHADGTRLEAGRSSSIRRRPFWYARRTARCTTPDSGECLGGPCRGARLTALDVVERDGNVLLRGAA